MVCRVLNTDLINIERRCGFFGLCLNFSKIFNNYVLFPMEMIFLFQFATAFVGQSTTIPLW